MEGPRGEESQRRFSFRTSIGQRPEEEGDPCKRKRPLIALDRNADILLPLHAAGRCKRIEGVLAERIRVKCAAGCPGDLLQDLGTRVRRNGLAAVVAKIAATFRPRNRASAAGADEDRRDRNPAL